MERLDGVGAIEFDEETALAEDAVLRDTVEAYNRRVKEFEEHSKARSRQIAAFQHAAAAHLRSECPRASVQFSPPECAYVRFTPMAGESGGIEDE